MGLASRVSLSPVVFLARLIPRHPKLHSLLLFSLLLYVLLAPSASPPALHPLPSLLHAARLQHDAFFAARSSTLRQAHTRYVAAHNRLPPLGYSAWFEAAHDVAQSCNIDQFTEMYESLEPWWGVSPFEIRTRTRKAGGKGQFARIRVGSDGRVDEWEDMGEGSRGIDTERRRGFEDLLKDVWNMYRQKLPPVDLLVNPLDDPRVILPYDLKQSLLAHAKSGKVRARVDEIQRFNEIEGFTPYELVRLSCPLSSRARNVPITQRPGHSYSISSRYTSNFTLPASLGSFLLSSDAEKRTWCDQPDLQDIITPLIRPLSLLWSDQLMPVFSTDKIQGFSDILYPRRLLEQNTIELTIDQDIKWEDKKDMLYWRDSNSGAISHGYNWLGWTRSRLVSLMNATPITTLSLPSSLRSLFPFRLFLPFIPPHLLTHTIPLLLSTSTSHLLHATLPSLLISSTLADVAFTVPAVHGLPASRSAQESYPHFRFTGDGRPLRDHYLYKSALSVDESADSPLFLALMGSGTAVWRTGWRRDVMGEALVEWYHYIPVSVRFGEMNNLLVYFFGTSKVLQSPAAEGLGKETRRKLENAVAHDEELRRIGEQGRRWANECARNEDRTLYVWLLVLEWGRLVSDEREKMGEKFREPEKVRMEDVGEF